MIGAGEDLGVPMKLDFDGTSLGVPDPFYTGQLTEPDITNFDSFDLSVGTPDTASLDSSSFGGKMMASNAIVGAATQAAAMTSGIVNYYMQNDIINSKSRMQKDGIKAQSEMDISNLHMKGDALTANNARLEKVAEGTEKISAVKLERAKLSARKEELSAQIIETKKTINVQNTQNTKLTALDRQYEALDGHYYGRPYSA